MKILHRKAGIRTKLQPLAESSTHPAIGKTTALGQTTLSVSWILDGNVDQPHDGALRLEMTPDEAEALWARLETMLGKRTATQAHVEACTDAARIVMEPRSGVSHESALFIVERLMHRAEGCGAPGTGRLPGEPEECTGEGCLSTCEKHARIDRDRIQRALTHVHKIEQRSDNPGGYSRAFAVKLAIEDHKLSVAEAQILRNATHTPA